MRFDWDPEKEQTHLEKHGVSFEDAAAFLSSGADYLEIYDEGHSQDEDRFIAMGPAAGRIIVVVYAQWPEDTIRLISARVATPKELRLYREHRRRGD